MADAPYRPPQLLRDLHLLDVLELSGTTQRAGQWLSLSQPTVSRRYRRLAADFGLKPAGQGATACRFGSSVSLRQLRLGFRWHRFETGTIALAADPLHGGLLEGMAGLLPMPMRFRPAALWRQLVLEGVLDGALVSSLEREGCPLLPTAPASQQERGALGCDLPRRLMDTVERVPLGQWPLALATYGEHRAKAVLTPTFQLAPGLHSLLTGQSLPLATTSGAAAHDPAAWLARLASCQWAAPVPALVLDRRQGAFGPLEPLDSEPPLREHLWLLLPGSWRSVPALQAAVEALQTLATEAGATPPGAAGGNGNTPERQAG